MIKPHTFFIQASQLRFDVGHRVFCNTGNWSPGTIVEQWYREPTWPAGRSVPYQVKLDDGGLVYAPYDDDVIIRSADGPPPPPDPMDVPDDEKLPVTIVTGFLGAGKTTLVSFQNINDPLYCNMHIPIAAHGR